ncbi:hypothetical protein HG536_0G03810 [Torulaspora globosa]|uniref:Uncharacterized protein n=1 Tax=Torulaspora globosa TaxID=48254 RepID=A0A7G3ZLY3_9SACH|nr:uncharacterized protein HG536_0G03810 [Torulaspora globosa]QLL34519.1 hypothetical protein HG536_0G03810 [Torulaspora globosa]
MQISCSLIYLILCFQLVSGHLGTWIEKDQDGDQCDEKAAFSYLNSLIEKHGARLQLETESLREDFGVTIQQADAHDEGRIWHVGEVSLSLLDKHSVSSLTNRLEKAWRLPWKLLNRFRVPELGLFFLSIGDTNIFDEL